MGRVGVVKRHECSVAFNYMLGGLSQLAAYRPPPVYEDKQSTLTQICVFLRRHGLMYFAPISEPPSRPAYVPPYDNGIYVLDVAKEFGLKQFSKNSGSLSKRAALEVVFEYSRFGKWIQDTNQLTDGIFVSVYTSNSKSMYFRMLDTYKYRQIRRQKGELCAAVRAERFHPRNSEKWVGWGI
jgi:hypothetical protein